MTQGREPGGRSSRRGFLQVAMGACAATALAPLAEARDFLGGRAGARTVRFVSGLDGRPVAGARVVVGGADFVSGRDGHVTIPVALPWSTVEAEAEGFLRRQTLLRDDETFSLWPLSGGLSRGYLRELVYGGGEQALVRLEAPRVAVTPSTELWSDDAALRALRYAMAYASEATGVAFRLGAAEAGEAEVLVSVDPGDFTLARCHASAVLYRKTSGYVITGGSLVLSSLGAARHEPTLIHELGHVCLWHSNDPADVMGTGTRRGARFSERELLALRLVAHRIPGSRFEDDDAHLGPYPQAVAAGRSRHVIVASSPEADERVSEPLGVGPVLVAVSPLTSRTVFACA